MQNLVLTMLYPLFVTTLVFKTIYESFLILGTIDMIGTMLFIFPTCSSIIAALYANRNVCVFKGSVLRIVCMFKTLLGHYTITWV